MDHLPTPIDRRLNGLEGNYTGRYFERIFGLLPEKLRPKKRRKFKAIDRSEGLPFMTSTARALRVFLTLEVLTVIT